MFGVRWLLSRQLKYQTRNDQACQGVILSREDFEGLLQSVRPRGD